MKSSSNLYCGSSNYQAIAGGAVDITYLKTFFFMCSSSSSHSTTDIISQLNEALEALELASSRVQDLSTELARRSRLPPSSPPSPRPLRTLSPSPPRTPPPPLIPGGTICAGDFVEILNPSHNQPRYGEARYACDRFIYVYDYRTRRTLHRFEINLRLCSSP